MPVLRVCQYRSKTWGSFRAFSFACHWYCQARGRTSIETKGPHWPADWDKVRRHRRVHSRTKILCWHSFLFILYSRSNRLEISPNPDSPTRLQCASVSQSNVIIFTVGLVDFFFSLFEMSTSQVLWATCLHTVFKICTLKAHCHAAEFLTTSRRQSLYMRPLQEH